MWGSTFPVTVFTDNRGETRFLQAKIVHPAIWNAWDYVLQCNFVIAQVAGVTNTAADFLSRTNPTEKLKRNLRNDIRTNVIDVKILSSGVTQEQFIFCKKMKLTKKPIGNKKTPVDTKHKQNHTINSKMK